MGVDLVDSRTGVEHAYGRRTKHGDVLATGMEGAGVFADVAAFAAAIESGERRRNSSILRDVQVALPCELGEEEGSALLQEFAQMLAERYDTHVAEARAYLGTETAEGMHPQAVFHFTREDQINALVAAREDAPDVGFMARLLALCTLPRTNPGTRLQYKRVNGPYTLVISCASTAKLPYGTLPR